MNRRALLSGAIAFAAVASCSPSFAPAAQEKIYPRAALVGMWPLIRSMRQVGEHGVQVRPLEEVEAAIMKHFASYGVNSFPASFESASDTQDAVTIYGFTKKEEKIDRWLFRELLMVFGYPGDKTDGQFGPHVSHIALENKLL